MKKKTISTYIMIFFLLSCATNNKSNYSSREFLEVLTKEEAIGDLDFLLETIKDVHPKAEYAFPEEFISEYKKVKNLLSEDGIALYQFNFLANAILGKLGDAHTHVFSKYKDEYLNLPCVWTDDGLVARQDINYGLKKGDIIRSIGTLNMVDALGLLEPYIPHENEYWVKARSVEFFSRKSFLLGLGMLEKDAQIVQLGVERNRVGLTSFAKFAGGKGVGTGSALGNESGDALDGSSGGTKDFCRYSVYKDELVVFTLDSCINNELYQNTVKEFFEMVELKGIQKIAIDLRENMGGDPQVIDEFLKFLPEQDVRFFGGYKRYSQQTKERGLTPRAKGYAYDAPVLKRVGGKSPEYSGRLYCLVSNRTFSSANWFAEIIQANRLGQIVGEPTGNAPDSYGNIIRFELPNSQLGLCVSWCKWESPSSMIPSYVDPDALRPGAYVRTLASDYASGVDPVLEWVLGD